MDIFYVKLLLLQFFISLFTAAPQISEINDRDEKLVSTTETEDDTSSTTIKAVQFIETTTKQPAINKSVNKERRIGIDPTTIKSMKRPNITAIEMNFLTKIYKIMTDPLKMFISAPKVNSVLRNIGVCIVNGAMELITFYLPAPLIPLIASAAGMVIPFEPVVMLKDRMPFTSYRRALERAVRSFLGTFDKYKIDDTFDDDPYMTVRFNRRFMGEEPIDKRKSLK